jgi:phosphoribosylaminoimidazole-succinocarboxamide synthase
MGSVKDLEVLIPAQEDKLGMGRFHFSDRYSVFDWGEMPDLITNKGKALCMMSAFFFEKIEEMGIKTHYRGLVVDDNVKRLSELNTPSDIMEVDLVQVLKPREKNGIYDYSIYNNALSNFLIPLEIIYRNSLPAGSSVFRRLKEGTLSLADIGLTEMPQAEDVLREPILDVSTKLEVTDRYMSWQEAQDISKLKNQEISELKDVTSQINDLISRQVSQVGLKNEDGKVEFGYDADRQLMLVDVLGTPDECRFTYHDVPVSKEVARIYYRNSDWYPLVEEAKQKDRANWKSLVNQAPPKLPQQLFELVSFLYQSTCNALTQQDWFPAPALPSILDEIREQLGS